MKIVMVCEFFNESMEYQENLLAKYYLKSGHDVTVIASTSESVSDYYNYNYKMTAPSRTFYHEGTKVITLKYRFNLLNKVRAYTSIRRILDEENPDLIYMHDIIPNVTEAVSYIKCHPGCKMIMDYHADYSNSGKSWVSIKILHGVIRAWFLNRSKPYLEKIFPIVPAGTTFLHEVYGVPLEDMEVLPLGTDLDFGAEVRARGDGPALRKLLGIKPNDFAVFTGGRLHPLKKTEHIIEAVRRLDRPDIHLLVVGDSSKSDEAYKEIVIKAAAGSPNIHFCGWQDKVGVYRHLAAANAAMFPASQSVLWQQAIGMGLPLVVSERSDLLRDVQSVGYMNLHDNIIILDHERPLPEQLMKHITDLSTDKALYERMSDGARKVADELLNWDRLILKTLRFNTKNT